MFVGNFSMVRDASGNRHVVPNQHDGRAVRSAVVASADSAAADATRQNRRRIHADFGIDGGAPAGGLFGGHNTSGFGATAAAVNGAYVASVIERFLPETPQILRRIYRDIYFNDPIGGGAVDLMANLPWSDFTLSGMPQPDMLEPFAKSVDNIRIKSLLPELSVDYMVLGNHVGALGFDDRNNVFTSYVPIDVESCDFVELPVYGMDPLINMRVPHQLMGLMAQSKKDKRVERALRQLPEFIRASQKTAKRAEIMLNPSNTLFVPRRTLSTMQIGTSYYRRLLAIYLWEKAMLTGTIESAFRRQRSILHVILGDEEHEPKDTELRALGDLFIAADLDPTGAVVVTRQGVQTNEVRCLAGDTRVATTDGIVPIAGMVVHDPDTMTPGTAVPIDLTVMGWKGRHVKAVLWHYQGYMPTNVYEVGDKTLVCTDKHRVVAWTPEGLLFVPIGEVGDRYILTEYGYFERVRFVKTGPVQPTYDLTIDGDSLPLFVADGVIVHNSGDEFWKYSDVGDFTSSVKFQALGINADFMNGNSSYNCVVGDTLVPTENGLLRIDDMKDEADGPVQDLGIRVASRHAPVRAATWHYNGKQPTLEVKTQSGNDNVVTPGHPFLVLRDGQHVKVEARHLRVGDLLCFNPQQLTRAKRLKLDLKPVIQAVDFWSKQPTQYDRPTHMTPELAWIVGALVAEGTIDARKGRTCVSFANSSETLLSHYNALINAVFSARTRAVMTTYAGQCKRFNGITCNRGGIDYVGTAKNDCYQMHTYSRALCEWFKELGLFVRTDDNRAVNSTHNKDVPWSILQADADSQLAFLGAYLDCDGSVGMEGLRWMSASQNVLKKIQIMLNAHGVWCRRRKGVVQVDRCWVTSAFWASLKPFVRTKDFTFERGEAVAPTFGFSTVHVRAFLASRKMRRVRTPGAQHGWAGTEFLDDAGGRVLVDWNDNYEPTKRKTFTYEAYQSGAYGAFLDKLKRISRVEHDKLVTLLRARYVYTPVTQIKKGKRVKVYDLSINDSLRKSLAQRVVEFRNPWFTINGLVAANTLDAAMGIFVEQLRAFRDMVTRRIFYNKLFPAITFAAGFERSRRDRKQITGEADPYRGRARRNRENGHWEIVCDGSNYAPDISDINLTDYHMPKVHWHKGLKPEADIAYLDVLNTLESKGVPIPLRLWASAGGLSLTEVLHSMDEDLKIRNEVKDYQKKKPKTPEANQIMAMLAGENVGYRRRPSAFAREYPEPRMVDERTGRTLSRKGRGVRTERLHKLIAEVAADRAQIGNKRERAAQRDRRKRTYSANGVSPFGLTT